MYIICVYNMYQYTNNVCALCRYQVAASCPECFQDVTQGSNRCTESGCTCKEGFGATAGWDAASGLGTPNFGRLVEAIDAMDDAREAAAAT
jgi:hypothetical protein